MAESYQDVLNADYSAGVYNAMLGGFFFGFAQFAQFGAQALCLWYGSYLLERAEILSLSAMLRVSDSVQWDITLARQTATRRLTASPRHQPTQRASITQ